MGKKDNSRQEAVSRMMLSDSVCEIGAFVALIIMVVIFTLIDSSYVTVGNFVDIVKQTIINGTLAIGITFTIISGGTDLSLGGTFAIVIMATGQLTVPGVPPVAAICADAALGAPMGSISKPLATKTRLQPSIATLGTVSVPQNIAYVVAGRQSAPNIPDVYRKFLGARVIGGVPISIFALFVITVIAHTLLKKTRFGNYLFAVGGNEETTRPSGVNVSRTKILAYSMCGFCVTFADAIMLANLGAGEPAIEQGYELDTVVASAIGRTRMAGGKGSILGIFLGALLLAALEIGLIATGISTFWQCIVTGIVIVIVACSEMIQSKSSSKFLKSQA